MNSNNITKNFIAAVKDRLTSDKWSVFDVNFTGKGVPRSSEEVRVHIKLDGNGGYLYGVNGYYDEPQNLISEQEFGDLLKRYYVDNNTLGNFNDWDFTFSVVSELHYYGIEVLPSYLDKDAYIRTCKNRDRFFAEYVWNMCV